jgi:hypothetical protein
MASEDLVESDEQTITAAKAKLRRDIIKWCQYQYENYPRMRDFIPQVASSTLENDKLCLPSSFSAHLRLHYQLTELANVEYDLREGQAHDVLQSVRLSIQEYNLNNKYKRDFVHGIHPNTRAHSFLQSLDKNKVFAADKYRNSRSALLSLGLPEDDKTFKPLLNSELWMKRVDTLHIFGGSKIEDLWFWTVGRPSGLSESENAEWSLESMSTSLHTYNGSLKCLI